MVKLIDILIEDRFERKESIKKTFHTYSCVFLIKFKKKFNRVQAVERVRGIKSVTIVDLRGDERLDKINRTLTDYEYSTVEVKFITNKDPKKHPIKGRVIFKSKLYWLIWLPRDKHPVHKNNLYGFIVFGIT